MNTISYFVTNPKEMYSQSLTMDFHNKARGYERRLGGYVLENFRASVEDFKVWLETLLRLGFKLTKPTQYWVYLTQLVQSEAMTYTYRGKVS